jgi:dienelactone hydrolase
VSARQVSIDAARGTVLRGELTVPAGACRRGVVAFAHGSGSSASSPRNRRVAAALSQAGFATLLFDLLGRDEQLDRANVFAVELLARRLLAATRWLRGQPESAGLAIGYFGASTGAAAALLAAAELRSEVHAVVSRGGRPDLAEVRLHEVLAPVLLVVGDRDLEVLELNRRALECLRCKRALRTVAGATHLFEEPGALEEVSRLAVEWFSRALSAAEGAVPAGHATRP